MPLAPLTLLTTLLHVFIGLRLVPALAGVTTGWPLAVALLVVSAATMPLPFLRRRWPKHGYCGRPRTPESVLRMPAA